MINVASACLAAYSSSRSCSVTRGLSAVTSLTLSSAHVWIPIYRRACTHTRIDNSPNCIRKLFTMIISRSADDKDWLSTYSSEPMSDTYMTSSVYAFSDVLFDLLIASSVRVLEKNTFNKLFPIAMTRSLSMKKRLWSGRGAVYPETSIDSSAIIRSSAEIQVRSVGRPRLQSR